MDSVENLFEKETFLKQSEMLFTNTKNWYDMTVLCVLLGLYFINKSISDDNKILALAKVQNHRQIDFKRLSSTLETHSIAIVINTSQNHYSALYLKKNGNEKIAMFSDPFGSDTPGYITQCCRNIGYVVLNENIRLQAANDSYNCGPLVIDTLIKFATNLKIRPSRNLLAYADKLREKDQAILNSFGIHTPEDLILFYSTQIHNLVMNDALQHHTVIDIVSNTPRIVLRNLLSKAYDTFRYENYDDKADIKSVQWRDPAATKEKKAYETMDNDSEAYVRIRNTDTNEKNMFDDIFDTIYQKVPRTKRSTKSKYCKEGNFIKWKKIKNKEYYVLSEKATFDDASCNYTNGTEKKDVFLPITKNQRQGLQKYIYIKKRIENSWNRLSIEEPRILKRIGFKNIGFY